MSLRNSPLAVHCATDQMRQAGMTLKLSSHWIMFDGHDDDVGDEAKDDHKVEEGIGDDGLEPLPERTPVGAADLGYKAETRHRVTHKLVDKCMSFTSSSLKIQVMANPWYTAIVHCAFTRSAVLLIPIFLCL